jgi:hypothetical protein
LAIPATILGRRESLVSNRMSNRLNDTPEKIACGVMLTLFIQAQMGVLDRFFDGFLQGWVLAGKDPFARVMYSMFGEVHLAADMRSSEPLLFWALSGVFAFLTASLMCLVLTAVGPLHLALRGVASEEAEAPSEALALSDPR